MIGCRDFMIGDIAVAALWLRSRGGDPRGVEGDLRFDELR